MSLEPSSQEMAPAPELIDDPAEVLEIILDPRRRGTLYPYYKRLRELDPVHGTDVLHGRPGWVLTSYEDAHGLLANRDMISDSHNVQIFDTGEGGQQFFELMKRTLLFLDPREHDRLRAFLAGFFTPRVVNGLRPRIQSVVDEILQRVEAAGSMDLVADFAFPIPTRVICEILGVSTEDLPIIYDWLNDFARRGDISGVTPEVERRGEEATLGFTDYFLRHIEERRKRPRDDFISHLVHIEDEHGKLSDQDLVATFVLLVQAGHETTANMIGLSTLALLRNPDQRRWLQEEPDRIVTCVDELIRYDSSVHVVQRVGSTPVQVRDKTVSPGEVCVILTGATNRDAERFAEPDRLDLERENVPHLTFGLGNHVCLGAQLARAELQIALGMLFARLPDLEYSGVAEPELRDSLFLRGLKSLELSW